MQANKNKQKYRNIISYLLELFKDAYTYIFFIYVISFGFSMFSEIWKKGVDWRLFNMIFLAYSFLIFVYLVMLFKREVCKGKTENFFQIFFNFVFFLFAVAKKIFFAKKKVFFKIFIIFLISFFLVFKQINLFDHFVTDCLMAAVLFAVNKKVIFLIILSMLFACFVAILFGDIRISSGLNMYAFYFWIVFLLSSNKKNMVVDNLVASKNNRVIIKIHR